MSRGAVTRVPCQCPTGELFGEESNVPACYGRLEELQPVAALCGLANPRGGT